MTVKSFVQCIKEHNQRNEPIYAIHHLGDKLGPILEAKPLGFGSGAVMVRLNGRTWVSVDPQTWLLSHA